MIRARDVALNVLERVEKDRAFAAAVLDAELKGVSRSRDAALATELVLGVLRRRPHLDSLLDAVSTRGLKKIELQIRNILRLGAYQIVFLDRIPARAAVSEAVNQARHSKRSGLAGLVNALLRRLAEKDPESLRPDERDLGGSIDAAAVRLGLPGWFLGRIADVYGRDRAFAMARAFNTPSRRTLRINGGRGSREEVSAELDGAGTSGNLTPWSMDVANSEAASQLIDKGLAAYQDEGAQLVAFALEPASGDRILDACAGRGGKTAALAMMTNGDAHIVATDRSASKLERLAFELDRQGFSAETIVADFTAGIGDREFSRILLDAPCSGTGTLGRRPEIRWRLSARAVKSLVEIQSRLLDSAARALAPGGRLVYAVCSLLPEEGEEHVRDFLGRHPGFKLSGEPPAAWPEDISWNGGAVLVDPASTGTDGYQIISLSKS